MNKHERFFVAFYLAMSVVLLSGLTVNVYVTHERIEQLKQRTGAANVDHAKSANPLADQKRHGSSSEDRE